MPDVARDCERVLVESSHGGASVGGSIADVGADGGGEKTTQDTQEVGDDATWKLAEVKANRGEKNRPMTRKQRNLRWQIAFGDITKANLHLDV